ncbi:hypothetical protein [Streptomyces sp. bgisy091]|uniref:hypothetical protein n=1 Tax=Streptomyces sp. bgisy091 TaxID=3413778 RepID=UPI003D72901C
MSPRQAVDAVTADIRAHHITVDGTGLFNATRHIGLLCQLAARMAADAEYQLSDVPLAKNLGASSGHLGRAIAHYTQALSPLITLTTTVQPTLKQKFDSLDLHRHLRIHLDSAGRALTSASDALDIPRPLPAPSGPGPAPLCPPAIRRHP